MMSEVKRGKLLILEGGVGCGKSTQFGLLRKNFPKWEYSREPGSTPFGEDIRDAVQGIRGYGVDSYAAFFAYTAARANLIRTLVNPKLKEGKNVVLDRYWYSTYAYQGAEGVSKKYIIEVSRIATDNLQPDLVIHYDLAPKIGLKRKRGRDDTDRYDLKDVHHRANT